MKNIIIAVMAALLVSVSAQAAIKIDGRQARNMDDVQSLGVISINQNIATEQEAIGRSVRRAMHRGRNTTSLS